MPKKWAPLLITVFFAIMVATLMASTGWANAGLQKNAGPDTKSSSSWDGPMQPVTITVLENTEARSKVAGAKVYIDGMLVGETNTAEGKLVVPVGPGEHTVIVSKTGLENSTAIVSSAAEGNYTFLMAGAGKKYSIFDLDVFFYALSKELEYGAVNTIVLSVISTIIGLAIGLIMGIGRISANRVTRGLASIYVEGIRGIPMLLLLLFIKYGLPFFILDTFGVQLVLDAFAACVIAISMNCGAYMAEIFKAGINAIGKSQMEAARSLGMSYWQALRFIIMPQAVKVVLPALGNEFISVIKGSSIALVIAYPEIVWWSNNIGAEAYNTFMPLVAAGIIYLCMTVPLSNYIQRIESRMGAGNAQEQKQGSLQRKEKADAALEGTI
ncbi:MAG TPA: ABC transporter permease subunit [Methanocella sp.]|uniref:ABC transporter permease subunit n=1 Tax=Methanocella sp. TaxID=2052833 RepID=UPI002BCEBEF9|nr:ABC transporter permease subunit [Methanocella sp.]HTY90802.1 ABC transporter permease subunit [Methanocella sp.]